MGAFYFTDDLRIVFADARQEAGRLHHEYVGPEHILLAYTTGRTPATSRLLQELNLEADAVRRAVEEIIRPGQSPPAFVKELPYTATAKKSLEDAMSVVRELGHNFVGIEHMLAGLIRGRTNIAAQVLAVRGVTEQQVVTIALGLPAESTHRPAPESRPSLLARLWRRVRGRS